MSCLHKRSASFAISVFLSIGILTPQNATSGANGMAVMGKVLGGGLVVVGAYQLYKDTATAGVSGWKIAMDVAMIAGGAMSLLNNSKTAEETKDKGFEMPETTPPGGSPGGGMPDLPGGSIGGTCELMPSICTCQGENCSKQTIKLPALNDLKKQISDSYAGNPASFPDGFSLEDALNTLDEDYAKAKAGTDAFNTASNDGAFSTDDTALADGGSGIDPKNKDGLNVAAARGTASDGGSSDTGFKGFALPAAQNLDLESLLNKTKKERGEPIATKANGLNLEDARNGRILTIFERITRVLRGTRDRDVVLAKMELTRKEALKRLGQDTGVSENKTAHNSNFAISPEKN